MWAERREIFYFDRLSCRVFLTNPCVFLLKGFLLIYVVAPFSGMGFPFITQACSLFSFHFILPSRLLRRHVNESTTAKFRNAKSSRMGLANDAGLSICANVVARLSWTLHFPSRNGMPQQSRSAFFQRKQKQQQSNSTFFLPFS